MKISVLIPTLGRKKELIETVRELLSQTRLPDELVVVDQNQPSIPEVDQLLSNIDHFPVKHQREQSPGVVINYNRCLALATGDVVLFLDDDVILDPKLIERHMNNYENEPRIGGVAGRVEQPQGDLPPEKVRVFGRYRPWSGNVIGRFNALSRADVQIAPGGNMSFLRKVLVDVHGFDEGFDGNGFFFETDGALRVGKAGFRIVFDPTATLRHLMAPSGGARIRDKAVHTYYYVKNGIRLFRRHSPPAAFPFLYLRMIFYVAAKAAYNRDLAILRRGVSALLSGGEPPSKGRLT